MMPAEAMQHTTEDGPGDSIVLRYSVKDSDTGEILQSYETHIGPHDDMEAAIQAAKDSQVARWNTVLAEGAEPDAE